MRTGSISRAWSVGLIMWLKLETTPSVLEGPCVRISFEPCLAQSCVARLRQKRKPVIFFLAQSTKTGTQWNVKQDISKRTTILLFCWTMLDIFRSNSIV